MNTDIKFYVSLAIRRLPIMLVLVVLGTVIGIGLAMTLPPTYRAEARLLVESAQIPDEMVTVTVQTSAEKQLQIIEERLLTRANMIDVANKYGVFKGEGRLDPDDVFERMQERTRINVQAGGNRRATVMEISFTGDTPQMASDIVNEFVTLVENTSAIIRKTEATETAEFFENEVERLSEELNRKSSQIVAFKEANKDALPEEQDYRLTRQSQLLERLTLNSRDLVSQREQRNRLLAVGTAGTEPVRLSPEQQQLQQLQNELNSALSIYSESNPRVKVLRAQIEALKGSMTGNGDPQRTTDPMQAVLELQLADIDARIEFLEADVVKIEEELARLQEAIEKTPENAIRLEALTRDYENVQNQYNQAVSSLATAKVGESIEVQGRGERVSVIERAPPPNHPSGPNRKLLAGGGVIAGTALATLLFVLLEMTNRAIRRPVDLMRSLGVQPLATIPFIEQESVKKRRRAIHMALIAAVIVAVPAAVWAVHTYYLPLDLLFAQILQALGL